MTADNTDSNIYFIDTGALVAMFRTIPEDLIEGDWQRVEGLFLKGRMYSHRFVYEEITTESKRPDLLSKKITPLQAYFRPMSFEQARIVADIIKRFPGLIDPENEREQTGPWLIAAAILEQRQLSLFNPDKRVYVISEEDRSDPDGISSVSRSFGLGHLDLSGLYQLNGWS